jgi:poly(hydroxyalkanoate) granule-associated protein
MEKRLKPLIKNDDDKFTDAILASAQQIWQAGLGAFSIAEEEGGKLFARLVKEGTDIQKRSSRLAEVKVSNVTGSMTRISDSVSKQASGSWEKIEQVFEDRVSRTLASLGVPSRRDIQHLHDRIEDLSIAVAKLSAKTARDDSTHMPEGKVSARGKATSKSTAKKPVRKRTPTQRSKPGATSAPVPEFGFETELIAGQAPQTSQTSIDSETEVTGKTEKLIT